jgi:hypothetical protein
MYKDLKTWGDVLSWLQGMSPQELAGQAAVVVNDCYEDPYPVRIDQIIGGGTVGELFGDEKTRSPDDNGHHPEAFILLVDTNPFSPQGDLSYTVNEDGSLTGDQSGEIEEAGWQ